MSKRKKVLLEKESNRSTERSSVRAVAAPLTAFGVASVGAVGYYSGIFPDMLDTQLVPQSSIIDGAVDGMVIANETIRASAPVAAIGMLGLSSYYALRGIRSTKEMAINHLSRTEYSGVDDMIHSSSHKETNKRASVSRLKKVIGGVGVASAALIMSTSGLEKDVTEGSLRPIYAVTDMVRQDGQTLNFILESEKNTFMDDSVIPRSVLDTVASDGASQGINVIPFSKELMNMNDVSSIQVSLPDAGFESVTGVEIDDSCETIPVIVDDTLDVNEGGTVSINGTDAQVIAVENGLAQMNRSVALMADSDMTCLKSDTDDAYFGAITVGGTTEQVSELIDSTTNTAVVEEDTFYENNKDFWRANGTPLILILMGSVAILGAAASANERRSALMRNVREIGMLNAAGVEMKDIKRAESRRALHRALLETAVAAPLAVGVAGAFNKTVSGLGVGIGLREVAVGATITWLSKEVAARRAVSNLAKQIDLSQAVKG